MPLRVHTQRLSGLLSGGKTAKAVRHRDACGNQLLRGNSLFHIFFRQFLMGYKIVVRLRLFRKGDTGVIRAHEISADIGPTPVFAKHVRQRFRREKMRHDNRVITIVNYIVVQLFCIERVGIIHRRLPSGGCNGSPGLIRPFEYFCGLHGAPDINPLPIAGRPFRSESQHICHFTGNPSLSELLQHCLACRIMSFSRTCGQYQYFHKYLQLTLHA